MIKFLIIAIAVIIFVFVGVKAVEAYTRVKGYFRNNGTYVQPHYRSDPNSFRWDNWSIIGNINPFTGKKGVKKLYP